MKSGLQVPNPEGKGPTMLGKARRDPARSQQQGLCDQWSTEGNPGLFGGLLKLVRDGMFYEEGYCDLVGLTEMRG